MTKFILGFAAAFSLSFSLSVGFVLSGDPTYNCHAYAWTDDKVWLDTPPLQSATEVSSGPIVVYFDGDTPIHSGKYLGYGLVKSKWGPKPVIYHPIYLSPYGRNVKFYER